MNVEARIARPVDVPPSDAPQIDGTLDIRGLRCSTASMQTVRALEEMDPGEVLEVLSSHPIGHRVPPWFAHRLEAAVRDDRGFWHLYYERALPMACGLPPTETRRGHEYS